MSPLILITNDDGVFSPGLQAVAAAVQDLGELLIVAPRHQQTGMSRSLPRGESIGIIETVRLQVGERDQLAYGVHGSPSLAVIHAVLELAPRLPDLCISGINYGENIGLTTAISGTVGAALEAHTCGIPALAVSLEADYTMLSAAEYAELNWSAAAHFTRQFALKILEQGLPPGVAVLNVNVPDDATPTTPIRATVQSQQSYFYFIKGAARDFALPHRLGVANVVNRASLEPNSDIQALIFDRVVSVTPLTGNLTANVDLASLKI